MKEKDIKTLQTLVIKILWSKLIVTHQYTSNKPWQFILCGLLVSRNKNIIHVLFLIAGHNTGYYHNKMIIIPWVIHSTWSPTKYTHYSYIIFYAICITELYYCMCKHYWVSDNSCSKLYKINYSNCSRIYNSVVQAMIMQACMLFHWM